MGQQKSKQMTEIVSEVISNTVVNTSKSCGQRAINSSNFKLVARDGGVIRLNELIIDQSAYTTFSCITESVTEAGYDTQLASTITNEVLQDQGWFATGDQKAVIENNIHNIIKTDNLIEDIQSTFQDIMNYQNFDIEVRGQGSEFVVEGPISVTQSIDAAAESLMTSRAVIDIAAYLENDVANEVEQKQSGFDDIVQAIVDFFKGVWGMAILAFIVVVVVIGWILGSGGGDEQKSEFQSQFQQEFLKMMKGGGSTWCVLGGFTLFSRRENEFTLFSRRENWLIYYKLLFIINASLWCLL